MGSPSELLVLGDVEVDLSAREVRGPEGIHALTPLEVSLLDYLRRHRGEIVDRDQLLTEVWNYSTAVVTRAVDSTVSRLRRKIEVDPKAPRWLVSVRGGGYRLELPAPQALPAEPDALVGRTAELVALRAWVDEGTRLITLVGAGGIGKTRLAIRFAASLRADGGTWFVDLTDARDEAGVLRSVAGALALVLGRGDPVTQIGHALAGRGNCVVVLDNCEQICPVVARLATVWLEIAGASRLLVTGRERLGVRGEVVFDTPPLDPADARELFVARASAVSQGGRTAFEDDASVVALVALLDGLPLAIELAAARVNLLTPRDLLDRMSDRFAVLVSAGRWRDGADRHRTLEAAFDWSWALLSPREQSAMGQLAVFEGGFVLGAAEALLAEAGPGDPLEIVQGLVDKCLVRRPDAGRLGLLGSIRDYARRRTDPGMTAIHEVRHGAWYARLGGDAVLDQPGNRTLLDELPNLAAASRGAVARGDAEVAGRTARAAWLAFHRCGPFQEGVALLEAALAVPGIDARLATELRIDLGYACRIVGRADDGLAYLELAVSAANALGDPALRGQARWQLAGVEMHLGRAEAAREGFAAALTLAREAGSVHLESKALRNLGLIHALGGRLDDARPCLEAALVGARQIGDRSLEADSLVTLGSVRWEQGDYSGALDSYGAARRIQEEAGDWAGLAITIGNLAIANEGAGRNGEAMALFEEALVIQRRIGHRFAEASTLGNQAVLLVEIGQVDEAQRLLRDVLVRVRNLGDQRAEAETLANMGSIHIEQGHLDEATDCLNAALQLCRAVDHRRQEALVLGDLGDAARRRGDLSGARVQIAAAEAILRDLRHPPAEALSWLHRAWLEHDSGDPPAAALALAEAETIAVRLHTASDSWLGRKLASARIALGEGA